MTDPKPAALPSARVAVITRTKSRPKLLVRALASVLEQHFKDWIHVVVNDGGDPRELKAVLQPFLNRYGNRLVVIHHEKSLGMEAASNAGIRACSSELLAIHDDDDSWDRDFLTKMTAAIDARASDDIAGAASLLVAINEEILPDGTVNVLRREEWGWSPKAFTLFRMAATNSIPPISFLFKRKIWEELQGFNEKLPVLGDWDFHLRVLERWDIAMVRERLANYHLRTTLQSGIYGNTVVAGARDHADHDARLRNAMLRADLAKGEVGMGVITNLSGQIDELSQKVGLLGGQLVAMAKAMGQIDQNIRSLASVASLVMKTLNLSMPAEAPGAPPRPQPNQKAL